ncbi:MAG: quinolinate synthase NadA [Candidatus Hydrogenedentes bacterium]|nr:quinolinate synthase NadA [Candidatus Hydrogenedentota bacterium]
MTQAADIQHSLSLRETRELMKTRLAGIVPEFEIDMKAEYAFEINQLKRQLNAVILGHNYMEPALYCSVPDYTGDSLELSRISTQTDADIIVFCGVQFMAETAKILNPAKTVLIPSAKAGCSLAAGITAQDVLNLRKRYPGAPVVSYVNTYASVKAESDYCCTSGNAAKVVEHLMAEGHKQIIFLPDEYLAHNTAAELKIEFFRASRVKLGALEDLDPRKTTMIGWQARCEVHDQFTVGDIENIRKQFPDVVILAHPECSPEVIQKCEYAGSTKQMIEYVRKTSAPHYVLLTECSMADNIAAENPEKEMLRLCSIRCPHMNQITLEETLASLQQLRYKIELDADLILRARLPIDRMLEIR